MCGKGGKKAKDLETINGVFLLRIEHIISTVFDCASWFGVRQAGSHLATLVESDSAFLQQQQLKLKRMTMVAAIEIET